jgi:hypothetical protein
MLSLKRLGHFLPRAARRKKSRSGINRVMLCGINHQTIFILNEEDCEKYLSCIEECKAISGFTLYAYCLLETISVLFASGKAGSRWR